MCALVSEQGSHKRRKDPSGETLLMWKFYWGTSKSKHFEWGMCGIFFIFNGVTFSCKIPVGWVIYLVEWKNGPFLEIFFTGVTSGVDLTGSQRQGCLGLTFDNCLTFEPHINTIHKKASQKISALARVAPYMNQKKKQKLMNAFFRTQFNYCLLVWMFHVRRLDQKTNHHHERCLRIVYSDHISIFEQL